MVGEKEDSWLWAVMVQRQWSGRAIGSDWRFADLVLTLCDHVGPDLIQEILSRQSVLFQFSLKQRIKK